MARIHVTGNPRAGKTSYVVARIITENMQYFNWRYQSACSYIKAKNKTCGYSRSMPPQRHVVYSNINIWRRYPNMASYPFSGWEFGAPNQYCPYTRPLMPYGVYAFDEAQRYFDSKGEGRDLPPWVTQGVELSGHIFLELIFITQRPPRLHKDIRSICDERIHIEKSIHTFKIGKKTVKADKFLDTGKLIKTEWFGREFDSMGDHETYVDGGKDSEKLGRKFKYVFEGDIRNHYNPYQYALEMEDLNKDFEYLDNPIRQRPAEWSNYKKPTKAEKRDGKETA